MVEFACLERDDAVVRPQFALEVMTERYIAEFLFLSERAKKHLIRGEGIRLAGMPKSMQAARLECWSRSIDDDGDRGPFGIVNLFSRKTFNDTHWTVTVRTLWKNGLG